MHKDKSLTGDHGASGLEQLYLRHGPEVINKENVAGGVGSDLSMTGQEENCSDLDDYSNCMKGPQC